MSIDLSFNQVFRVTETIEVGADLHPNPPVVHSLDNLVNVLLGGNLTGTSTPQGLQVWSDQFDLVAGAATLDLENLAYPAERTAENFNGNKIIALQVGCPSTNTAPVTIAGGATNPYELFGSASTQIDVAPGMVYTMIDTKVDNLVAVSASVSEVDLSSSDTDATVAIILVAGN